MSSFIASVSSNSEFISDSNINNFNNSDNNKKIINSTSSYDDDMGNPVLEKFYDKITSFVQQ
jgi:hypothetical protein